MRRIFAVFIFLLSTSANAQWNIQSAIPTHLDVTNVSSPATGKVFNAANGDSWFPNSSGTTELLNDVDYFSNGDLIAVGTNGTVLTNTGGGSIWINQPAVSLYSIKAVQIVNPTEVVILDEIGQVYKSVDAGVNWTATNSMPPDLSPAEDIHFTTLQDGWVIGQGGTSLYHTSDGGNTWIPVPDLGGGYVSVDVQGSSIWANNVSGSFSRSIDNGNSWITGVFPGYPHQIMDMDFFDENIGYAVGYYGEAFRSSDGGATWQVLPTPNTSDQLTDIYLVGPDVFWVSTNSNAAYYSANGGLGCIEHRLFRIRFIYSYSGQPGCRCMDCWI
jgi:hypothetical protein